MGDLLVVLLPEMFGLIVTPGAIAGCVLLLLRSRSPVPSALAFGGAFVTVYTLIALAAILGGASDPGAVSPDTSHGTGLVVGVLFLLFLMISGMSYIAGSPEGPGTALLATLLLLVAASFDFLVPIGVYLALGDRARIWLGALEKWVLRHSRGLSLAVLFGFGALFTARGLVNLL
jgi:hypothetical protein